MKTYTSFDSLADHLPPNSGTALTLGVFDGLHIGHQALINLTIETARSRELQSLVITFADHPLSVLAPPYCPKRLLYQDRKAHLAAKMGADLLAAIEFNQAFASQEAAEFVERVLVGKCRAKAIICGYDFTFGKSGQGNTALLREMGTGLGFEVKVVEAVAERWVFVKSSHIRDLLFEGAVEKAAVLLTRPYELRGEVMEGFGRGRTIGFPTANLKVSDTHAIPARGVYLCAAMVPGMAELRGAMVNIGFNPTFGNERLSIEAHLLDFEGDLRGKTLSLFFLSRLRDEHKFANAEALVDQLRRDRDGARRALESRTMREKISTISS